VFNQDNESVTKILTLRYNPDGKPGTKKLSIKDFMSKKYPKIEDSVISLIKEDFQKKENTFKLSDVSISLSSGIDSGLTLVMLRKFLPNTKVHCVSVGFANTDDETKRAEELARIYDSDFHRIVLENVFTDLPKLIKIVKEPRWHLYPYYTFEYGKKRSNVFFTGDGGDELFGGYTFRYKKFLSDFSKNMNWKNRAKLYLACHERDWVPDQEKIFGKKIKFSWDKIYKIFTPYFRNKLSPLDQVFLSDFNGKLVFDWIPTNKEFSKSLNLKIESLFLTNKMIKFATQIPWSKKYDPKKNIGKIPIRKILANEKGFEKKKIVKKGFGTDLIDLWKNNGREIVGRYVNEDSEMIKNKIINIDWVDKSRRKIRDEEKSIKLRYINKMFSLLAFEIWFRLFVTKNLKSNVKL